MAKRLDRFLVAEQVGVKHHQIKQWVACGGQSNHLPIFLELKNGPTKPPSPLKLNKTRLNDDSVKLLISSKWLPYDPSNQRIAAFQFAANIKNLKEAIKDWSMDKRRREDIELKQVEKDLFGLLEKDGGVC